jgi:biopolymer transport protein ExbD
MAQLDTGGGAQGGKGKKRAKKASTAIDMTPMVDLAFLLLTFFVLTSTFSKPKVLRMIFPEKIDKNDPAMKAPEVKNGLTILLTGENKIYYYKGSLKPETELIETDYTKDGIRKVLVESNLDLLTQLKGFQEELNKIDEKDTAKTNAINAQVTQAQKDSKLVVLLKHDKKATYGNVIDIMDEFLIAQIAKYFKVDDDMAEMEKKLIADYQSRG